jgi:hypothetical protein
MPQFNLPTHAEPKRAWKCNWPKEMDLKIDNYIRSLPCGRFVSAKLFAGLAILALGFAFASSHPSVMYTPTATIVFDPSPRQLQLFAALVSTISALAYFAVARWSSQSPNNSLSIVHFVLFAAGVYLIAVAVMGLANSAILRGSLYHSNARREGITAFLLLPWPMRALVIGTLSVRLGCLIFVMNLGMMALKIFRSRRKSV